MWTGDTVEWIDIELTSYCNIDCPGCFRQVKRKKVNNILDKKSLSLKQIKKWITKKTFPNCKLINFCGSIDEPTLHPELLDILDHFEGLNINISSNGSTKTKQFWANLGNRKISVFFGIDGIDQESLEKYRIGSNFKKVQENWRSFIKAGGKATWQFIAFEHNEHLIEDAKHMAKEEGFENFRLIYSHRDENKESKTIQREEEQEIVCKYGVQKRIFLSHTGALLPCCFFNSEYLQDYAGNVVETRFMKKLNDLGGPLEVNLRYNTPEEVMSGELYNSVVESWKNKPMERCWNTCKRAKQDVFIDEDF
tara:strand:+ start:4360 stop:5283 length:924 start_codon:yes stop_codon:yes gene_type:complete